MATEGKESAARRPASERSIRTAILIGAGALLAGIALAISEDELGRWLSVGGLVALFVSLHRLGRLGPD